MATRTWGFLAVALLACAAGAESPEEAFDPAHGRTLYQFYCSSCHGGAGTGNGPVAGALRTRPADLTLIAGRRSGVFPTLEITSIIDGRRTVVAHGTRQMPVWGRVLGQKFAGRKEPEAAVAAEIRQLVEYLRSIQLGTPADG